MASFPSGTVTFLFTDIEGSTKLLQELGDAYATVVADHRRILRDSFGSHEGREVDTQGDAFFFSFPRAREAVAAAVEGQRALAQHEWPNGAEVKVRMGLHTGEPAVGDEGYIGMDVVRAARICSAGSGGQILLSETTRALAGRDLPAGVTIRDLGEQQLKDVSTEHVYQLDLDGGPTAFPALKTERRTAADDLGARIERMVEQHLEAAFSGEEPPNTPKLGGLAAVGLGTLAGLVAILVGIVFAVKWLFF
jgi:class 3 adenylate cyclase